MTETVISRLPAELHSSAHQVRYDNTLIGEYEVRVYRGVDGPVVVLEPGSASPLPLEYMSELAVSRFATALPNASARFFERHVVANQEVWVEVGYYAGQFFRSPCNPGHVAAAVAPPPRGEEFGGHVRMHSSVASRGR